MPVPDLPEPAYAEVDSMLSRKFGKEVANYFSGKLLEYDCSDFSLIP